MLYQHVFGKVSSEFCGISRELRGISQIYRYLKFVAPRLHEMLEALFVLPFPLLRATA